MFTGLVQTVGEIQSVRPLADGLRIAVAAGGLSVAAARLGDSVAVNGVCLTVVGEHERAWLFDVSGETLRVVTGIDRTGPVNLELAMKNGEHFGGHVVSGHVDGVGQVSRLESVKSADIAEGENWLLEIEAPAALAPYIAQKGSITVNGVSLTVNQIIGNRFAVNLIPHTWAVTTLSSLSVGSKVNLEVDLMARYAERLLHNRQILTTPDDAWLGLLELSELLALAHAVGLAAKAKGGTLATAESCSGGLVGWALTQVSGSSAWFEESVVTYSNRAKTARLGVDAEMLASVGAVSSEVAEAMVRGLLAVSAAAWGVAITGIAGPDGGSFDKPVGTVWLAFAARGGVATSVRHQFLGDRASVRLQAARAALQGLTALIEAGCQVTA